VCFCHQAQQLCDVKIKDPSKIITEQEMSLIWLNLPSRVRHRDWRLLFSSEEHGCSVEQLYRFAGRTKEQSITVIKDSKGRIFGAYTNEPWQHDGNKTFGTGASFVWTLTESSADYDSNLRSFPWTKLNDIFMVTTLDFISIGGGGEGPAIYLDGSLLNGRSNCSATFENACLASNDDFKCIIFEVWGLGWKKLPDVNLGQPAGSFFQ